MSSSAVTSTPPASEDFGKAIESGHSRIAEQYGLVLPGKTAPPAPSFEHYTYERTVVFPLRMLVTQFRLDGEGSLLDAGCGNGQFLDVYARLTEKQLIGVDFSHAMLEQARRRATTGGYEARAQFLQGDIRRLEMLPDRSCDVVHCFGVIDHLAEPELAFAQFQRVLKPGGVLLLAYPKWGSLGHLTFLLAGQSPDQWGTDFTWSQFFDWKRKAHYYRFYRFADIERLARDEDFVLEQRLPIAPLNMVGWFNAPSGWLLRRGDWGYRVLRRLERWAYRVGMQPVGEYLVFRK